MYDLLMNTLQFQKMFLNRIGDFHSLSQLLNLLPDVAFFMKDRESRFVMNNQRGCAVCGVDSEEETVGKTDYDFFPPEQARVYHESDQAVLETGEPMINALEPSPGKENSSRLIVCSKVPVRDKNGTIIGIAGIHRMVDGLRDAPKIHGHLSKAVDIMHKRFSENLKTPDLAKEAGLSPSQFDRQFRRVFRTTPREYLLRVRIHAACRLLAESHELSISIIATDVGFYDHSHFSRIFRRIMGITPGEYRKRHTL
jgi:AraC-like DNA-binding protein